MLTITKKLTIFKIMGYVYLLLQYDSDNHETYKIGITKRDINKRISELQTGNPNKITLIKSYESDNYLKIESWLHKKFKPKNEKGEWFNLSDDDVFSFENECIMADDNIKFLLEHNEIYKKNNG